MIFLDSNGILDIRLISFLDNIKEITLHLISLKNHFFQELLGTDMGALAAVQAVK